MYIYIYIYWRGFTVNKKYLWWHFSNVGKQFKIFEFMFSVQIYLLESRQKVLKIITSKFLRFRSAALGVDYVLQEKKKNNGCVINWLCEKLQSLKIFQIILASSRNALEIFVWSQSFGYRMHILKKKSITSKLNRHLLIQTIDMYNLYTLKFSINALVIPEKRRT